ncbi:hypothetical protein ACFV27_17345 [Streptomyces antimycoticus]|uniref:hypothetical protein n=1 Tax=Streptomyces antimycoticus TaxID=68175 RepID=UPI0036C9EAD7
MEQEPKLLEPIATVASVALRLIMGLLLAWFLLVIVRGEWGGGSVCVTDWTANSSSSPRAFVPEPGASVDSVPRYCAQEATTGQSILAHLGSLASLVAWIGGLFLLNRLLGGAARTGVHTPEVASRLRLLGWWLVAGSVMTQTIVAFAQTALLGTLSRSADLSAGAWIQAWNPPYLAVLTGLGLLAFARITRVGSKMREDLEGLV